MEIEAMAPAMEEVEEVVVVDMVEGMQVSGNISTSCLTSIVLSIMHIVVFFKQIWSNFSPLSCRHVWTILTG